MRPFFLLLPALLPAQDTARNAAAPKTTAKAPATSAPKSATAAKAKAAAPAAPMTEEQKQIYAVGLSMYQNLIQLDLTPAEMELVKKALSDSLAGRPAVKLDEYGPKLSALAQGRMGRA